MTTTVSMPPKPTAAKRPPYMWIILTIITAILLITGVSLWFSPIGARYRANPAAAVPAINVSEIMVQGDAQQNHVFAPAVVQVPAGTTLTWQFNEVDEAGQPVAHNVIFEAFGSEVLETGTYTAVFEEPGVYAYRCTLHPFMEGKVIVTE